MSFATAPAAIPTTFARRVTALFPADTEAGLYYHLYLNLAGRVVVTMKDRNHTVRTITATVELATVIGSLAGERGDRHLMAGRYRVPLTDHEFATILAWR